MEEIVQPKPVTEKIDISRRDKTMSDKVAGMLVTQLSHEIRNHNIYRTFQNFYALAGLDKIATYYEMRALEELEHHNWIRERFDECDVPFSYIAVEPVEYELDPEDLIEPFRLTVDIEIQTTEAINQIANIVKEEDDEQTYYWLQKTLIDEQHEEESTSRTALDIAKLDGDWMTKGKRILHLLK